MPETVTDHPIEQEPDSGEQPFLVITAHLSARQYETAFRRRHAFRLLKLIAAVLAALLLFDIGLMVYYRLTPGEFFGILLRTDSTRTWLFCGAIVLWFVFSVWYYPRRSRKYLADMYGDRTDLVYRYSFFNEALRIDAAGEKASSSAAVRYADLRRIRVIRHSIILKTKGRTAYWIGRDNLSYEDGQQLLQALREHTGIAPV